MSHPRRVYLFQVNYSFGDGSFLPYSVGTLRSYSESDPVLNLAYRFMPLGHRRDPIGEVVSRLVDPSVVGLSCYVWNWQWNMRLAEAVRERFPDCLIVLGGPQVPDDSRLFFEHHPYVDLLVHGEGEVALLEILHEWLGDTPDFRSITGLSIRCHDLKTNRTMPRSRLEALDELPSPYVSGAFDDILDDLAAWSASQETNRGCPYSCTFCDWGSAVLSKVRQMPADRVRAEIEWFASRRMQIIYNCDANYGMFERDLEWAEELARQRLATGFPQQFRTSYAKKSDERVFEIAAVLFRAGLQRGVGISLQSLDEAALLAIRRRNLGFDRFTERMERYRRAGIPTYTELIVGLPGEKLSTFKEGIQTVLEGGQHESLLVYPCQVLPNAELANPSYRAAHGISTVVVPLRLGYSSLRDGDVEEYIEIVVSTATMPEGDWRDAYVFGFAVQAFHCLNLTQVISVALRHGFGFSYREFYEWLIRFGREGEASLIGELMVEGYAAADGIRGGASPGRTLTATGPTVWNPEEIAFLQGVFRKSELALSLTAFLDYLRSETGLKISDQLIHDLVSYQMASVVGPGEARTHIVELHYDLAATVEAGHLGNSIPIRQLPPFQATLSSDLDPVEEVGTYALEMLRYGRKNNHLRRLPAKLNSSPISVVG